MLKFIDGKHVESIREMIARSTTFNAAVAFWGSGAVSALDLKNAPSGGNIVCNLSSMGCNPREIEKLYRLGRFKIWSHDGLHAKVYLSDSTACVGSSNASGAGLDFETNNLVDQREANAISSDPQFVQSAHEWFKKLVNDSDKVSLSAINTAIRRYDQNSRSKKSGAITDILDAAPDVLDANRIAVAVWSGRVSDADTKKIEQQVVELQEKGKDFYLDLPHNVSSYPYGRVCIVFEANSKDPRKLSRDGVWFFREQTKHHRFGKERVILSEQKKRIFVGDAYTLFHVSRKSEEVLQKLLLARGLKLRKRLVGPTPDYGFFYWESLSKLLKGHKGRELQSKTV